MKMVARVANEKFLVILGRLVRLEKAEKDLVRAKGLIRRLRAEIAVYKQDRVQAREVYARIKRNVSKQQQVGAYLMAHRAGLI